MTTGQFYSLHFKCFFIARTILLGMLIFVLTGCVGAPKLVEPSTLISPVPVFDEKTAQEAWRESQIAKYGRVWTRQSVPNGDPYRAGQAAYYLALATFCVFR
jgi:hypothetical protein